jgi:DNA-binding beta-propeller fold protein YncE
MRLAWLAALVAAVGFPPSSTPAAPPDGRYLYVATPGIRNYLEYGGHGLLVFDIDRGHAFVRRIPTAGLGPDGQPLNVKGVVASAGTGRIHITTTKTVTCLDLVSEKILWEKDYPGGCDRLAASPDGRILYVPSFEGPHWNVVDALSGELLAQLTPNSGAHNTVYGLDGRHVYMAGLRSPLLAVADTATHTLARSVGPFSQAIRPFTVNGRQTLAFVNVNGLLGFEVGDIPAGKMLHRVEVAGFSQGPVKRHGCPSHGIGLTPDETEVWVVDAFNRRLHLFDATVMPPRYKQSLEVRDEPGWITFSLDGRFAYPSTGDVIETATRKIVAGLTDERGTAVQSEKMVEVHFEGGQVARTGSQFGVGRVTAP